MHFMDASAPLSPDVLGTPEGIANPYPAYRAFRSTNPVRYLRLPADPLVGRTEPLYSWALLRHADVLAAVRDPATFSSQTTSVLKAMPKLALVHDDPPHHTQLRRVVNKVFSSQRIAALSEWVGKLAHQLLEAAPPGPVELMGAYAVPLPMRVIAGMLGVPDKDYPSFKLWSEAVISYVGMSLEERTRKTQEMMVYLGEAIAARRAQPSTDLLSALVEAEVEGSRLSDVEIRSFAAVLLIAGNETTTNLIGNMLALLADRPELWSRARADRSLVDPIVEETLRYETPVQRFPRVTKKPVRIGEVEIGAGELVDIFFGAANRDPSVFEDPETFRPERPANSQHLGFGMGTHYCLGAMLARLEARITLNAMLDRFPTVGRGAGSPVRQQSAPVSLGYKSLPLVLGGG
jgi:cytochrome P450